jgi:uncharacterized protein YxeA
MTAPIMKKYSIILIALIITIIAAFYLWTAREAKNKSDDLISKFKEVERSLDNSTDSTPNNKGIGAIEQLYSSSALKSQIILLIDSLKENFENIKSPSTTTELSKHLELDFKRLLHDIQQFNKFKWDMVDSKIPDTVKYWSGIDKFSEQKWLSTYFKTEPKEAIITYLNYLRNQFLTIN